MTRATCQVPYWLVCSHCSAEEEHTEGLPRLHCSGADSPVSSSYSELRQAQHHVLAGHVPVLPGHVGAFPPHHQEGDYEPVIPPKVPAATSAPGGGQQKHFKSLSGSSSESTDYLGTCVKCGDRIVGEGTGCSAMGRPYHILCFTCSGIQQLLSVGSLPLTPALQSAGCGCRGSPSTRWTPPRTARPATWARWSGAASATSPSWTGSCGLQVGRMSHGNTPLPSVSRQAVPPQLLHLRGLHQESGWNSLHCGRCKPDPLH